MPLASTSFLHTHPGWEATAKSKELLGETERQPAFARLFGGCGWVCSPYSHYSQQVEKVPSMCDQ